MQQLAESMGSLAWALPVFGLQQIGNVISRPADCGSLKEVAAAFDAVTKISIEHCGAQARQTFEAGDKIQKDVIGTMFKLVPSINDSSMPNVAGVNPMHMLQRMFGGQGEPTSQSNARPDDFGWGPVPPSI